MDIVIKGAKVILDILLLIILIIIVFIMHNSLFYNTGSTGKNNVQSISPFSFSDKAVTYNTKVDSVIASTETNKPGIGEGLREDILNRAKAMTEVKWVPKYNLIDKKGQYTFIKGKTYEGVPYSMDLVQVTSSKDFLDKITNSKTIYGNDCSGFVSAAWAIKRQTTLSLYNVIKAGSKIDGQAVIQIAWEDLKPGDALLMENGNGKGHVMLYIGADKNISDNLNVYEQNIATAVPLAPIPVARRAVRSKSSLIKNGYRPIRLMGNT